MRSPRGFPRRRARGDMAPHLCEAGTVGIGLLKHDSNGGPVFRRAAVSGECVATLRGDVSRQGASASA
jgi:hypothetical protein